MEKDLKKEYEDSNCWGLSSSIDLYTCDAASIRDAEFIKKFVIDLCEFIDMKRFGECTVVNFGEDSKVAGFSMTQLIETSLISAHFANESNNTYLDVFSCKFYDPNAVAEFAKNYFKAENVILNYSFRK
jgi:S-adenosylmethionine/arginine decarboxylase-like enzyme